MFQVTLLHPPHELEAANEGDGADDEHGDIEGVIVPTKDSHREEEETVGAHDHVPGEDIQDDGGTLQTASSLFCGWIKAFKSRIPVES